MRAKIAVVTVSGRAYYFLVNELKKKKTPFLSLTPADSIPMDVKVVLTTKQERPQIEHRNVLEYVEGSNPAGIVDEAIRITKGKREYERLVVGVDPGLNFGIAVFGDGGLIEATSCTSPDEAVNVIGEILGRIPATHTIIRIGNGAPSYAEELWANLNEVLPSNVIVESVSEEGTSRPFGRISNRRGRRDVSSAIRIGQRQGRVLPRRKGQ